MRLVLISPAPFTHNPPFDAIDHLINGPGSSLFSPPLGLLYLATFLQNDYDVSVFDSQLYMNLSVKEIAQKILIPRPDIVGIGVNVVPLIRRAKLIAKKIKQIDADVKIIFGGNAATFAADQLIRENYIDIIVLREGEINFSLCLDRISKGRSLSDVPGIVYKEDVNIKRNDFSGYIENLDTLPFPSYDFLEKPEIYVKQIISSRGCTFKCIYCSPKSMWKKWRGRSAQNVVDEIRDLVTRFDPGFICFMDDNFVVDRSRAIKIAELIKAEGFVIKWGFAARIDMIDEEMLKIASKAGCKRIYLGIESGSKAILEHLHRPYSIKDIEDKISKCIEYGILPTVSFMIGMPWETEKDVKATFNLMQRVNTPFVHLYVFVPIIGTEIYDFANRYDLKIERDISENERFLFDGQISHSTKHLSSDEIKRLWIEGQNIVHAKYRDLKNFLD
ncbi:MAG: anaerobic magnesium-protoporphyrin monomethyl ester cyclase [Candidatus Poribacteria bacterium]|nr:anaerobic magnesium-protoporphyrin monomethyl ester cyclase [Candidatus Poribacteria bacterium]